jgi:hypothetical protein
MINIPPLVAATPGDPITSEGWNAVLTAIGLLVDDANLQRGTFTAQVRANGNPLRGATVTVAPTGEPARPTRGGVFVGGAVQAHQIESLLPGTYNLIVEADGFATSTTAVTMPADSLTVTIDLVASPAVFPVPSLLGHTLSQALATLSTAGFIVARVIDSHGADVPPGNVPADTQSMPVLAQFPLPNTRHPKDIGIFIHVAAKAEATKKVATPDIRGMSVAQAKAALEAAGLVLGTTKTVTT